ncbi:hypothetical protein COLO4_23390 [Corchorus olitorius]|uniref:Uncharacterized protein n=1 Tax=Corchorus olitorius TaxID=93759 RepID=A0A1R3IH16_9ROSI|nr:hypothetical protein COLO4_23390 [Corchorus olitorius]
MAQTSQTIKTKCEAVMQTFKFQVLKSKTQSMNVKIIS